MPLYHVSEIAADGERYPVPAHPPLWTGEALDAFSALNAYMDEQGFAHYAAPDDESPDAIRPWYWTDEGDIASAPFTNTEIMAYTDEGLASA